jgi:hypothetical protein
MQTINAGGGAAADGAALPALRRRRLDFFFLSVEETPDELRFLAMPDSTIAPRLTARQ